MIVFPIKKGRQPNGHLPSNFELISFKNYIRLKIEWSDYIL